MFKSELKLIDQVYTSFGKNVEALIAIDEVGRGCVAGPVLTCASVWIKTKLDTQAFCQNAHLNQQSWVLEVKDSKKLTPQKRLSCYNKVLDEFNISFNSIPIKTFSCLPKMQIQKPQSVFVYSQPSLENNKNSLESPSKSFDFRCVGFCLGEASVAEVEQFNIWNAVQIAASRALLGLHEYFLQNLNIAPSQVILLMDGNKSICLPAPFLNIIQVTAIKGDDLFVSVGFSSIMAKVYRDLFMESQENRYPAFGFSRHKGYGTAHHFAKIREHGPCDLHRLSFLKNILNVFPQI